MLRKKKIKTVEKYKIKIKFPTPNQRKKNYFSIIIYFWVINKIFSFYKRKCQKWNHNLKI